MSKKKVKQAVKKQKQEFIGKDDDHVKYDAKKIPIVSENLSESPKIVRTLKPKIDLKVCTNSYNCIIFCPHDAIDKNENGRPVIDYNLCTGCLICLRECPTNAISEERDTK